MDRPGQATAALVRDSARIIARQRGPHGDACRAALADALPVGHPLRCPTDPDAVAVLVDGLLRAVLGDADDPAVVASWRHLSLRLARRHVTAADWQVVGHVLLRTTRQICGDAWSSSVSSGWIAYHLWMQAQLASGAAAPDAPDAPPDPGRPPDGRVTLPRSRHRERRPPGPATEQRHAEQFQPWTGGWG